MNIINTELYYINDILYTCIIKNVNIYVEFIQGRKIFNHETQIVNKLLI